MSENTVHSSALDPALSTDQPDGVRASNGKVLPTALPDVVAFAIYAPCGCLVAAYAAERQFMRTIDKYRNRRGYRVLPSTRPVEVPQTCALHQEVDAFINRALAAASAEKEGVSGKERQFRP